MRRELTMRWLTGWPVVPPQLNSLCLTVEVDSGTISYWPAKCFLQNTNTDVEEGGGRRGGCWLIWPEPGGEGGCHPPSTSSLSGNKFHLSLSNFRPRHQDLNTGNKLCGGSSYQIWLCENHLGILSISRLDQISLQQLSEKVNVSC